MKSSWILIGFSCQFWGFLNAHTSCRKLIVSWIGSIEFQNWGPADQVIAACIHIRSTSQTTLILIKISISQVKSPELYYLYVVFGISDGEESRKSFEFFECIIIFPECVHPQKINIVSTWVRRPKYTNYQTLNWRYEIHFFILQPNRFFFLFTVLCKCVSLFLISYSVPNWVLRKNEIKKDKKSTSQKKSREQKKRTRQLSIQQIVLVVTTTTSTANSLAGIELQRVQLKVDCSLVSLCRLL